MMTDHTDGRTRASGREWPFALLVTALFLLVAGYSSLHHEMWRDELQAWLIARDSADPWAVIWNSRYDGHPSLWFLLLWMLARTTHSPEAMQVLNVLFAAGAVFVFAWTAPAPRWVRSIAAFGYFPVYEYGTIARNYAVALLLLTGFCALYPRRRDHPLLMGGFLFLLANTSLPAFILAAAGLCALVAEMVLRRIEPGRRSIAWAGIAIAAAGIVVSGLQMMPPSDSGFATGWNASLDGSALYQVLATVTRSYVPLPRYGGAFWQTDALGVLPDQARTIVIPGVLIGITSLGLVRRPVALVYYLVGTVGLLAFFYVKTLGYLRHHGFLFLCFGTALWLARESPQVALRRPWDTASRWADRVVSTTLAGLLVVHLVGAGIAVAGERSLVFSAGKATAELIRARRLQDLPLVADRDYMSMSVVGYLDKDRAFFPAGRRYGSYVVWDQKRYIRFDVWAQAAALAASRRSPVLVLLDEETNRGHPPPPEFAPMLQLVGCRSAEVVLNEGFCVYLLGGVQGP